MQQRGKILQIRYLNDNIAINRHESYTDKRISHIRSNAMPSHRGGTLAFPAPFKTASVGVNDRRFGRPGVHWWRKSPRPVGQKTGAGNHNLTIFQHYPETSGVKLPNHFHKEPFLLRNTYNYRCTRNEIRPPPSSREPAVPEEVPDIVRKRSIQRESAVTYCSEVRLN